MEHENKSHTPASPGVWQEMLVANSEAVPKVMIWEYRLVVKSGLCFHTHRSLQYSKQLLDCFFLFTIYAPQSQTKTYFNQKPADVQI